MKGHLYRVTVEYLEDDDGAPVQAEPLVFETRNNDDIFALVERNRARTDIEPDEAAPLAVGLRLLSQVALMHRREPLFIDIMEALGAFIGRLKGARREDEPDERARR